MAYCHVVEVVAESPEEQQVEVHKAAVMLEVVVERTVWRVLLRVQRGGERGVERKSNAAVRHHWGSGASARKAGWSGGAAGARWLARAGSWRDVSGAGAKAE